MPPGRETFEQLLAAALPTAFGVAIRFVRNRDDAEDLVQEASLRAFRSFHTFTSGTNFRAWLLRILTNLYYQKYRQRQREPQITELEDAPDLYLYIQTRDAGLHQRSDDPAGLVLERLSMDHIAGAIDALPDDFRMVAALYFMEEFSYEEIAGIVDVPIGTVRSRLHRGRKLLQKSLWQLAVDQGLVAPLSPEAAAP